MKNRSSSSSSPFETTPTTKQMFLQFLPCYFTGSAFLILYYIMLDYAAPCERRSSQQIINLFRGHFESPKFDEWNDSKDCFACTLTNWISLSLPHLSRSFLVGQKQATLFNVTQLHRLWALACFYILTFSSVKLGCVFVIFATPSFTSELLRARTKQLLLLLQQQRDNSWRLVVCVRT